MDKDQKIVLFIILGIPAIIIIFILFFGSFYIINAGERGVLLTWGKPDGISYTEGIHFKIPLAQKVVKFDVKTQKLEIEKASAASKDLQTATTSIAVNYYLSPDSVSEVYTKIGLDYQGKIMQPAILEVVKASTAQYTADELVTLRPEVKEKIDNNLRTRLREYNIIVQAVSITDFKFSDEYDKAIEAKVTAEQNALAAKNKLEQIKFEAQQKVESAKAEAESLRLQKQEVTPELIRLRQIEVQKQAVEKWDGKMPLVVGGSSPLIDISSMVNSFNAGGNNTK